MAREGSSRILEIPGGYHVWTRKMGEGPVKMLTLHGGPGANHEYLEVMEQHLDPSRGGPAVEFYYYDQLGSYYADQPDDPSLWNVARFRDEVEAVRTALGLDRFILYGQSWGGMLAIEYALQYQEHLAGLVISNMTASIRSYVDHLQKLRQKLPAAIQRRLTGFENRKDYFNPEYQELLVSSLYNQHLCRLDPWPEAVVRGFERIAMPVYMTMQGPNEFVVTGNFAAWDRWDRLSEIRVPTLLLVGRHDTMDPADIEEMGRRMPAATVAILEQGSHLAMWDDEAAYFRVLEDFLRRFEA
ncbi:MAG: proline iminopeptidase-family hydrolase [Clostridia bacterium]